MKSIILFVTVVALLFGCADPAPIKFEPNSLLPHVPDKKLRVAVAPFEYYSPESHPLRVGDGGIFFAFFMPGYLYAKGEYYNDGGFWTGNGGDYERFEDCLAKDLSASGLFFSVDKKNWSELSESHIQYDLIISGKFYYDRTRATVTAYGLSTLGIALQLLPIPVGYAERDMYFQVEAYASSLPNIVLWKKEVKLRDPESSVLFWGPARGTPQGLARKFRLSTPLLLKTAFQEVRTELLKMLEQDGQILSALEKTSINSGIARE